MQWFVQVPVHLHLQFVESDIHQFYVRSEVASVASDFVYSVMAFLVDREARIKKKKREIGPAARTRRPTPNTF